MPSLNGIGYSEDTIIKERAYRALLEFHVHVTLHVMRRNPWFSGVYHLIDANAGNGAVPHHENEDGSPLIALKSLKRLTSEFQLFYIEQDEDNCDLLDARLGSAGLLPDGESSRVLRGDNRLWIPRMCFLIKNHERALGLIYHDPTGLPDWELLATANAMCPKLDHLIWINSIAIKRCRQIRKPSLLQGMKIAAKKYWLVREPEGRNRFSFALGVNNGGVFRNWSAQGFYRVDSPRGEEILNQLEYTEQEWREMNSYLLLTGVEDDENAGTDSD